MDEVFIEAAEAMQEEVKRASIAKVSGRAIPDKDLQPREYLCESYENCGDDLPEFRKQKGLIRCVRCQSQVERRLKQRA